MERHVPAFRGGDDRPLHRRLTVRAAPASDERRAPGDDLHVRDADAATRPPERMARPEPNAPLLKRVIRSPYVLETARARRERYLDEVPDRVAVEPRERPGASRTRPGRSPSPLRAFDHRPAFRPHPFSTARALAENDPEPGGAP